MLHVSPNLSFSFTVFSEQYKISESQLHYVMMSVCL